VIHLVAFTSSISNTSALLQLNQVADAIIPASNNGFLIPPTYKYVLGVATVGASIVRAQLGSASFRDYGNMDLEPVNVGTVFESPVRHQWWLDNPLPINGPVELDAYAAQGGAGAEFDYAFAWLWDGQITKPKSRPLQVHGTASATLVAKNWGKLAITLDNPLDQGTYALVGGRFKSATALAWRVIPTGGDPSRAGGLAVQAVDGMELPYFRNGGMGTLTTFTNYNVPSFEIFAVSADTSEECILDLVPL
jgi:hypothetical protein